MNSDVSREADATIAKYPMVMGGFAPPPPNALRFSPRNTNHQRRHGRVPSRECCQLDAKGKGYLEHAMEQMDFSARAHDRIIKVSRPLTDPAGKQDITGKEVLGTIQFRSLDRRLFE